MKKTHFIKKLFISICMISKTTNIATRFTGTSYFLPQLFAMRFANMGGINLEEFKQQLAQLKTFHDSTWCSYWNKFAKTYENEFQEELSVKTKIDSSVIDKLVKSITYYSISAWPGVTPLQLEAYQKADALTEQWFHMINSNITKVTLKISGEDIKGYMYLPKKEGKYPMIIVTNGLEGTIQEVAFPIIKYCDEKTGVFFMEMPGTYIHKHKMSVDSEAIYNGIIEYVAKQPNIDSSHIAMIGVSFGGYWSTRMAAVNPNLHCAVTSGPPVKYAFEISNSFGLPSIMISVMKYVLGAKGIFDLITKLKPLSFKKDNLYKDIKIPFLIINGDNDTLVGTRDSIELNRKIPTSLLKLYEDDDHCAMGHYHEWIDLAFKWIHMQFNQE